MNAAPVPDFSKEMAVEEGVDRDLELELENLTFLEEQNQTDKTENKDPMDVTKTDKKKCKTDGGKRNKRQK